MKSINRLLVILTIALFAACDAKTSSETTDETSSENNVEQETTLSESYYGEEFSKGGAVDISLIGNKLQGVDSLEIKLVGTVNSTCAMKGCWMKMGISEDEEVRVTFKDYGFFVPKEGMEGKIATINGYAKRVVTDVETLRHFAEDAGKSLEEVEAITEPKEEITFVASGVVIEDAD
ncbi:MAG: DUF4920 domain-containing protein [Bacteroidota bacterium]